MKSRIKASIFFLLREKATNTSVQIQTKQKQRKRKKERI